MAKPPAPAAPGEMLDSYVLAIRATLQQIRLGISLEEATRSLQAKVAPQDWELVRQIFLVELKKMEEEEADSANAIPDEATKAALLAKLKALLAQHPELRAEIARLGEVLRYYGINPENFRIIAAEDLGQASAPVTSTTAQKDERNR